MRINTQPKLNFDDVLLEPKRSTLSSRKATRPGKEMGCLGHLSRLVTSR